MNKTLPTAFGLRLTRWVLRILAATAIGYVSAVLTLVVLEDRLLFHPHRGRDVWLPPPLGLVVKDVWLTSADGTPVHAWWCPRDGSHGAVLFCHGNAGNLSQRGKDLEAIRDVLCESVLVFDYPGFGKSPGKPSEAGCYAAADAAYAWLVQRVEPGRIILLGQSLGGGVATDLASRQPHRALALLKTFCSVPEIATAKFPLLPLWLARNRFDNLRKIGLCSGPLFVAHGDRDHLIPLSHARHLFDAAPAPKQFFLMEGAGHAGGVSREFLSRLAAFLGEK